MLNNAAGAGITLQPALGSDTGGGGRFTGVLALQIFNAFDDLPGQADATITGGR